MDNFPGKDWQAILSQQAVSGLTKKAFCEQHGLNLATFYYWQRRFRASEQSSPSAYFHRLEAKEDHELRVCLPKAEVVLRSASAATLAQVIKAMVDA